LTWLSVMFCNMQPVAPSSLGYVSGDSELVSEHYHQMIPIFSQTPFESCETVDVGDHNITVVEERRGNLEPIAEITIDADKFPPEAGECAEIRMRLGGDGRLEVAIVPDGLNPSGAIEREIHAFD
jgi:hypothetical protein